MRRRPFSVAVFALAPLLLGLAVAPSACSSKSAPSAPAAPWNATGAPQTTTYEGYQVVWLKGTPYEMGQQHGQLLHDTLIQGFSGITMAMQALAARLPATQDQRALEQIVADAGTSLREARRSLSGLRSRPAAGSDLADAIAQTSRQLTEARGIRLKLRLDTWDRTLPPDVEDNLLRIAQEAVLNAVKHSGARSLLVALERTANRVRLVVKDDGSGFDGRTTAVEAGHYGVLGMRERAAHIGAELSLDSAPGNGTAVSVTMDA